MIHQYRLNGFNIVLDVNSGSVHCVDDASYDIIRLFYEVRMREEASRRRRSQVQILGSYEGRDR